MSDKNCFEPNGGRITVHYFFKCMAEYAVEQDRKRSETADDIKEHVSEVVDQVVKRIDDNKVQIKENTDDIKGHAKEDKNVNLKLKLFGIGLSVILLILYPAALVYVPKAIAAIL